MSRPGPAPAPQPFRVELPGGPMDLRVEGLPLDRAVGVRLPATTAIVPLHAAVVSVEIGGTSELLDRTRWMWVPARRRVALRAHGRGARVLLATAHPSLLERTIERYRNVRLDPARLLEWLASPQVLPRTVWVDEIVQRYLFERQVCGGLDNDATRFLEVEIVKEAYFLLRDRDTGADRASLVERHSAPVERAVAFIEAHLFERTDVAALARHAGASESTLLRGFKREVGSTPSAYWRMRRLDEALVMLESGRWSVTEVAIAVGYENAGAFAHAFSARFGRTPSELLPRRAG
ncbi:MAG: AraC family transcriptional regulator [Myxococcota bacterium]|nr:AraC family transcriptional regulator [Myxococcota bacterium]